MNPQQNLLTDLRISGFRSLKATHLPLGRINVVIGPNGAGKSNLLSSLRMLMLMRTGSLRRFVGEQGGAAVLLHYGPKATREIEVSLTFASEDAENAYQARLGYAAGDSLIFLDESARYAKSGNPKPHFVSLGAGHSESLLAERARQPGAKTEGVLDRLISRMSFFHFHDTSWRSPLRQNAPQADNRYLRSDGSNLASFLYRLRQSAGEDPRAAWKLLGGLVRRVAPYIKEIEPNLVDPDRPEASSVRLYWTDERDHHFDAHDLSDGTLRAIALFAALSQPESTRPAFITIDEPELGLHPAAISIFVALVRSASVHSQILIATQSPALLDEFEPDEIIVTERKDGATSFTRLDLKALEEWLEEYSLSELYDKNVFGGRP